MPDPGALLPTTHWPTALGLALCVALASYVQNLTGFAFGLVLLGLGAGLHLVSVADAANAVTLIVLYQTALHFRTEPLSANWRVVRPALWPSLAGVALGVTLLGWLSGQAIGGLRALLGLTIIASALSLLVKAQPRRSVSGPLSFGLMGALSGLMGGLFSAAGPPLVYHLYRQPLDLRLVRECLLLMFGVMQVLRLVLVGLSGQFSVASVGLALGAVPIVWAVSRAHRRWPLPLTAPRARKVVAVLLSLSGLALLLSAR